MTVIPPSDFRSRAMATIGAQPIAFAAAALVLIVSGIGAILLWRVATGMTPETERAAVVGRQVQARVVQTSEQIMEKTNGLAMSQQESIDQLQAVQDQLHALQQMVAAQRAETRKLTEQVGEIGSNLDGLRQSFASARTPDVSERPAVRQKPAARSQRAKAKKPLRKRTKSRR
ncbi:conserved hypothetical protein [Rhodopseudomonas palustris HaA2]|uniref:Uncharacterized protein n=1 Tax=Rhodopseudomonas palustris (strain HaA2) TaxID=316058 RepID=Q2IUA5_RHOP2|nr:hypothetical protein [Rhodopseudomonas palustris]ABD08205.1 conserved hypothetical protein [Rhodopseudomonas palustris HaA2]